MVTIPVDLKKEYPFKENFITVGDGHKLHYVEEGKKTSPSVVMVHGNPTWSFYYRNVIKKLAATKHVIVPDHIGCGLSDKPQRYNYTLENHINNLKTLIEKTLQEDETFDLIVHDWGGAIGFGLATAMPDRVGKVVILNTAAFTSKHIPKRINLCKIPFVGEQVVRRFNAFAKPATFMAVEVPLTPLIKKGYLLPYNNYSNRIATARFVSDIPMSPKHPTWAKLKDIETKLSTIKGEKLILWGEKDFCFNDNFYKKWLTIYPEAKTFLYKDAGHYILEDKQEDVIEKIGQFLYS
jgi:haloalkane dehalogenase